MNCTAEMLRHYAVTARAWVGAQTLPQQVDAALKGGATCVQRRDKFLGDAAILAEALEKWPRAYLDAVVPQLMPIIEKLDELARTCHGAL